MAANNRERKQNGGQERRKHAGTLVEQHGNSTQRHGPARPQPKWYPSRTVKIQTQTPKFQDPRQGRASFPRPSPVYSLVSIREMRVSSTASRGLSCFGF